MNLGAGLANSLWLASGLPDAFRFHQALESPERAQSRWLRETLVRHADSEFGRTHDFFGIRDPADFARRVPLCTYDDVEPYVARIASGERNVLARGPVTHLAPTSGSTGARKLVPFTQPLSAAFNAAVFPWLLDLVEQRPGLVGGPAYWSISPLAGDAKTVEPCAVPIGFADDAEYLGASRAWLVRQAMAVPSSVRFVRDVERFWLLTLLALLRHRDLRLISIWHPSFMELLTAAAATSWKDLVEAVGSGRNPWQDALPPGNSEWETRPDSERAAELARIGPEDWPGWWPELRILSCWGEQAAEPGWRALVRRLPRVLVQSKGLLATECVVTVPLGGDRPLAVTSHYFEFLTGAGDVRGAHQLEKGRSYEVVVTNGGGLWRYRLGDVVECAGHLHETPSLRFVGRDRVSDLRGEKLSEAFVAEVLRTLWTGSERPAVATLRPRVSGGVAAYELLVSDDPRSSGGDLGARLDAALSTNPHYALARRLGQLSSASVVKVSSDAGIESLRTTRGRIGDVKPRVLLDRETSQES